MPDHAIRKSWPKVRIVLRKGIPFYEVDPRRQKKGLSTGGKRVYFKTKKEALVAADLLASEFQTEGSSSRNMDSALRVMAVQGKATLEPFNKTIADAVAHYHRFLLDQQAKEDSKTIAALAELWFAAKTKKNADRILSHKTVEGIAETTKLLRIKFGHLKILEAEKNHFVAYLDELDCEAQRRKNICSLLKQFFNWCILNDFTEKNPLSKIKIIVPTAEVSVLSSVQARRLMMLCRESFPDLIIYHAVSLFAGLRPGEASQLKWEDVNTEEQQITVYSRTSKVRRTRRVQINETLKKWLVSYKGTRIGHILNPKSSRRRLEKLRAFLGYKIRGNNPNAEEWPQDVMRHSFGSYWLAKYKNKQELSLEMGNTPKVIDEHYIKSLPNSEVNAYWSIIPLETGDRGKKRLKDLREKMNKSMLK